MGTLDLYSLPINPDEGFPQTFKMNFAGHVYTVLLYANIAEERLNELDSDAMLSLPSPGAFLVMRVSREGEGDPVIIFQRKLVPELVVTAQELLFVFHEMTVARGNLNGPGALGSVVEGEVAARWAS